MKAIKFEEGTIFYWQKTLAAYIAENGYKPIAILPRQIDVKDESRLVLDLKAKYMAKGKEFVETISFWNNRVLDGNEVEALDTLGVPDPEQCILHFGIYFPKETDPAILTACAGCEVPDDFGMTIANLNEEQQKVVIAALNKTKGWKIDTVSDGVKSLTPSGERAKFEA